MSDPQLDEDDREGAAVRALIKRSIARTPLEIPDLLPGVQRRIRRRSRGKLFGERWSATQVRAMYVLIGLVTLSVAILAYFALAPTYLR